MTPTESNPDLLGARLATLRVIPVVVIENAASAVPMARALLEGGLSIVEITLRTPAAMAGIAAIAAALPQMLVGAGTVLQAAQFAEAAVAGARFAVSPGATPDLLDAAAAAGLPYLPGAATASEAMALLARGYSLLKFFPAEAAGGVAALKALNAPLPEIRFVPTGGISAENASEYLACPNVVAVGGSWLTPPALLRAAQWDRIADLARRARGLVTAA